MAIISQKVWDNLIPEEEKEKIINSYNIIKEDNNFFKETEHPLNAETAINALETIFGKENLQPKPKIKTWKDVSSDDWVQVVNIDEFIQNITNVDTKIADKLLATLKIAKLIELGYGGIITDEEWLDDSKPKYVIYCTFNGKAELDTSTVHDDKYFIAFHTSKQREEFVSYPENVKLLKQYYIM